MIVELHWKTRKGRNVIVNHGQRWEVLRHNGNRLLIKSKKSSDFWPEVRWIDKLSDEHFQVTEIHEL